MSTLGEACRALADQRDAYFAQSAMTRGGCVAPFPAAARPQPDDEPTGRAVELSEAERYAMDACADGREYRYVGGFLVD